MNTPGTEVGFVLRFKSNYALGECRWFASLQPIKLCGNLALVERLNFVPSERRSLFVLVSKFVAARPFPFRYHSQPYRDLGLILRQHTFCAYRHGPSRLPVSPRRVCFCAAKKLLYQNAGLDFQPFYKRGDKPAPAKFASCSEASLSTKSWLIHATRPTQARSARASCSPAPLTADTTRKVHGVTEAEQRLPRRYAPRLGGLFRPLLFLSGGFHPLHELSSGRLQGR